MTEENTWKSRENLKNTKKLVEEFKKEYGKKAKEVRYQKDDNNKKASSRKLLGRFIAKVL